MLTSEQAQELFDETVIFLESLAARMETEIVLIGGDYAREVNGWIAKLESVECVAYPQFHNGTGGSRARAGVIAERLSA